MANNDKTHQEKIEKLRDMIQDISVAMLTTQDEDGTLRSRPMVTQETEFDGDLWFFTREDSGKVHEAQKDHQVNVSFAEPSENLYVSVSGTARLVNDRQKMRELWNPLYKAWFPDGLDDPTLSLLKIQVTKAEYWDSSPSNKLIEFAGMVKAAVTGEAYEGGENKKINNL